MKLWNKVSALFRSWARGGQPRRTPQQNGVLPDASLDEIESERLSADAERPAQQAGELEQGRVADLLRRQLDASDMRSQLNGKGDES